MTYPHNGRPPKPSAMDRLFTLNVPPWASGILLAVGLAALIGALVALAGCGQPEPIAPAPSAAPKVREAAKQTEAIPPQVKVITTAADKVDAIAKEQAPAAAPAIAEQTGIIRTAAGTINLTVQVIQPALAQGAAMADTQRETSEAQAKQLQDERDAANKRKSEKAEWAAGGLGALMAGALVAAIYLRSELFGVVAGVAGALGAVAWVVSNHIQAAETVVLVGLLAVVAGLCGWGWLRAHQKGTAKAAGLAKDAADTGEALWSVFKAAESSTIGGAKHALNVADEGFQHWLETTLTDEQFAKVKPLLPKL